MGRRCCCYVTAADCHVVLYALWRCKVNIILVPGKQHLRALCATFLVPLRRSEGIIGKCHARVCTHKKVWCIGGFSILVRAPEIWLNKSLLLRCDENLKRVTAGRPLALFTSGVCPFLSNFHAVLVNLNGKLGLIYLADRVIIGLCGAGKASGQAPVLILNAKLCPVINVAR